MLTEITSIQLQILYSALSQIDFTNESTVSQLRETINTFISTHDIYSEEYCATGIHELLLRLQLSLAKHQTKGRTPISVLVPQKPNSEASTSSEVVDHDPFICPDNAEYLADPIAAYLANLKLLHREIKAFRDKEAMSCNASVMSWQT
uniref:Uncharacterized protein n=1 Tax=Cacopsylla melanoneura TaxID=428564 RepID=A0A8D8TV24_9HEMI